MSCKPSIDPTLDPEVRRAEGTGETIQLQSFGNSFVGTARIPPEILGYILQMTIEPEIPPDGDVRFAGIRAGSYNFLFVCHRWHEIAHHTPGLWTSWGNTLRDWRRRHLYHETVPLDLILNEYQVGFLDASLREALESRAARGLIRKILLRSPDTSLLTSIISSLTPRDGGIRRHSNVESIMIPEVDVSDFFARQHFPKLRNLELYKCSDFALNHLKSTTVALVNLSLRNRTTPQSYIPTASHLISLLASNPGIRDITLWFPVLDDDVESEGGIRVPLRHLKEISLVMDFRCAFTFLQRLEFPGDGVDRMDLGLVGCTLGDIKQVIGPYIRDRLQGHGGTKAMLSVSTEVTAIYVTLKVSVVGVGNELHEQSPPYTQFTMTLPPHTPERERTEVCAHVLTLPPRERVACLVTSLPPNALEEPLISMPNIEILLLRNAVISDSFLLPDQDGPNAHDKLLPSLRVLILEYKTLVINDDWEPFVRYLVHQTSGDHSFSQLQVNGEGVHICLEVQEQMRNLVEEFDYSPDIFKECPFDRC